MDDHDNLPEKYESAIAVVGMACHLPGALNIDEYWSNLREGVESVKFLSDEELLNAGETSVNIANPNYVKAQPVLENFDRFDAKFWGFGPQDAAVTDPAHRIFLEVAYQALEHSGHTGYDSEERVGVFATSGENLYRMNNLQSNPQLVSDMGEFLVRHTGNCMNFLATRFSYELDLRGPSINVQTACSSTLVGLHMAVQSLLSGECDSAVVGGSVVVVPQNRGYMYREGEILSPDGHCRPFDAKSAGTVFGSGAGAIVVKRLEDAISDGDTIHAIVRGTAINNDGSQKIGYLAPSVDGQAGAISEALTISDVDAGDISYIETHGTGTQLGDPIEFEALNQVFREATDKRDYCRIGSVKSNIGHLGEAAGAAALIKVILSLKNQQLPPTINFVSPNPQLDLNDTPFMINDKLMPWTDAKEQIAGVTALGAGGTNASVILETAPKLVETDASVHQNQLIVLSAKTESALNSASRNLAKALSEETLDFADVAHTLQVGRRAYKFRRAVACKDAIDAIGLLNGEDSEGSKRVVDGQSGDQPASLVFMFPGGGAQYSGMGRTLYESESVYRDAFDACMGCLDVDFADNLKQLIFAPPEQMEAATKTLQEPSLTLTSLFATEYALARQLMAWGAQPTALIGHSMGENTAACIAGVMSLKDAMNLVLIRGQLFERSPEGGMLSISMSIDEARGYMPPDMDVAAINSPDLCVASGSVANIDALQTALESAEVDCHRVRINVAAHSRILESILADFEAYLNSIELSVPEIPFTSNLTGDWITDEQATSPSYWVDHLRNTVRFADNVETVLKDGDSVLVEIGPGKTLTNLALSNAAGHGAIFNSMRHSSEAGCDAETALRTLGRAWASGASIDWEAYRGDERRQRIPLPTYPFERKKYFIEPGKAALSTSLPSGELTKRPDVSDWFAQLRWKQSRLPAVSYNEPKHWIIFADEMGMAEALLEELKRANETSVFTIVKEAERYSQVSENSYELNAARAKDFEDLLADVFEKESASKHVVYCWSYPPSATSKSALERFDAQLGPCFWGLFHLGKILSEVDEPLGLTVISSGLSNIGSESCESSKAVLVGPVTVLPHELPHVSTQSIDVHVSELGDSGIDKLSTKLATKLVRELNTDLRAIKSERFVAYRGTQRWVQTIEAEQLDAAGDCSADSWLRKGSNILVSGGLGGIGLSISEQLAKNGAKNIILLSRNGLPDKDKWDEWLSANGADDACSTRIEHVRKIEGLGACVHLPKASVTDLAAMKALDAEFTNAHGAINGVIHGAGKMDDQLVPLKSSESAESVLDAKVRGAYVLDAVFKGQDLDFFVLFSSIASYLGLPGQIDYTAANATLDAFAKERSARETGQTVSVNWNAWAEVGMAAAAAKPQGGSSVAPLDGSLGFGQVQTLSDSSRLYSTSYSGARDWLLSEHLTQQGSALIPGTGFLEIIRACVSQYADLDSNTHCIQLNDVQFLSPFEVPRDGDRCLNVLVEGSKDQLSVVVFSDTEDLPHVTCSAALAERPAETRIALTEIQNRCTKDIEIKDGFLIQSFMDFGPRWGCIRSISYGQCEAAVAISLPDTYADDLNTFKLHPAALDMATGSVQSLMDGFSAETDFYVPVGYGQVQITGDMPTSFTSHIILKEGTASGFLAFDISLYTEQGVLFLAISDFMMKKVESGFASNLPSGSVSDEVTGVAGENESLVKILREGILPHEGMDAFNRVMSLKSEDAQWIISSVDSAIWQKQLDAEQREEELTGAIDFVQEDLHDADADSDIALVEVSIGEISGVESVIVRSFLDDNSRRRLVAYYTPDDWEPLTVTELREQAQNKLGKDLLPQQFVQLDEFPLDENGEINRIQLIDPFAPVDHFIPPKTSVEKRLAKIWQGVVGVPRVGLNENFFDIGGHSLLSIRVIVRVKKEFGVRLDQAKMVLLTLEQMAKEIDDSRPAESSKAKPSREESNVSLGRESQSESNLKGSSEPKHTNSEEQSEPVNVKRGLFARFKKGK